MQVPLWDNKNCFRFGTFDVSVGEIIHYKITKESRFVDAGMKMSFFNNIHQQSKCSSKLWPWFDFWWISKLHIWYIDYSRMILRLLLCDPSWPQMILMMIIIISVFEIVIMNSRLFFVVSKIYEYHQDWN